MPAGTTPKAERTKLVSMRYPEADIERAQDLARQRGIGYQTYIKRLVREGLDREESAFQESSGRRAR